MIKLKTASDIEQLAAGGKILADVLQKISALAQAGHTTWELEEVVRALFSEAGVKPAFLNYAPNGHDPFPAALCVSVNHAVVHGIPKREQILRDGDVVGLDLGLIYNKKYYLDAARTVIVGQGSREAQNLVAVTRESLQAGITAAQPGARIGDIGSAVQQYAEGQGYEVVRQLVGHGVGFAVHEAPQVPNFGQAGRGEVLKPGLVIAIEPMVTIGDPTVQTADDGWAVETVTGNLAAHFEDTVAITAAGPRVLTR